jgi:hypothetical protein
VVSGDGRSFKNKPGIVNDLLLNDKQQLPVIPLSEDALFENTSYVFERSSLERILQLMAQEVLSLSYLFMYGSKVCG